MKWVYTGQICFGTSILQDSNIKSYDPPYVEPHLTIPSKMSGVILVASVIIWSPGYYPKPASYMQDYKAMAIKTKSHYQGIANQLRMRKVKIHYPQD